MALTGRVIKGIYKLLDEIGSGGMATVYVARSLLTNEIVAVKILHSHIVEQTKFVKRFKREGKILSGLLDRHIIRVCDYGVDDNLHFIVTEYVTGFTLDASLEGLGPLNVDLALGIARQVAEGLRVTSDHSIVHRDIRPGNLMITRDGVVKIADFGIAKSLGLPRITEPGFLPGGTPFYVSPEQLKGDVDIRSDIYSLGVTLYEMLIGQPPFIGENAVEVALKIEKVPPPSLSKQRNDISPELEALVHSCLAKRPQDRFQTPQEFMEAIDKIPGITTAEETTIAKAVAQMADSMACREPTLLPATAPSEGAALVTSSGQRFPIRGAVVRIGRKDRHRGIYPDIDLRPVDSRRQVSRLHAQIRRKGERWVVLEENGVLNGTWVNNRRIRAGVEVPIKHGDRLRLAGVRLIFEER